MAGASLYLWQIWYQEKQEDGHVELIDWGKDPWGFEFEASELRFTGRGESLGDVDPEWELSCQFTTNPRAANPTAFVICRLPRQKELEVLVPCAFLPGMRFYFCNSAHTSDQFSCRFERVASQQMFFSRIEEMNAKGLPRSRHCYLVHTKSTKTEDEL